MIGWTLGLIAVLSYSTICSCRLDNKMKIIYSWKKLEFAFPSQEERETAINQGSFIPGAPLPIDVDVYRGDNRSYVFVTIPRFLKGVPATLGYVTNDVSSEGNPIIAPYPNWEYNKEGDCSGMTSVYRVAIDECDRLWILDNGKVADVAICPPKLHIFSLKDNKLIHTYTIPSEQLKNNTTLLITPVVDIRNNQCDDAFLYAADSDSYSLIVYDYRNDRSWRVQNKFFYPCPEDAKICVLDECFDLMDGLFGLALGPVKSNDRILYFHTLASKTEARVATSVIRNYTNFAHNPDASPHAFQPFKMKRPSQSAAEAMSKDGILFFGLLSSTSLACWNSQNYPEYGGRNIDILLRDKENLQFPSGLKVRSSKQNREEVWTLTSSFQKYMTGTLNPNETNFRILAGFVDELVRGTKCSPFRRIHGLIPFSK